MRFHLPSLVLALAVLAPSAAHAESDDGPVAWATVDIWHGHTTLHVYAQNSATGLPAAVERISEDPDESEYGESGTQWTIELNAPSRVGLMLRQELPLEPLLEALHAQGQTTLLCQIHHPNVAFIELPGTPWVWSRRGLHSAYISTARPTRPLVLELGWRPVDVMRFVTIMGFALVAPILIGLMIWRRSILRDRVAEAWFGRAQAINVTIMVGWALWMAAVEASQIGELAEFAAGGRGVLGMMTAPVWVLGFLPAAFALVAIARRIMRKLRGFDSLPPPAARFMTSVRTVAALLFLVIAVAAFTASNLRVGVFALMGAIVTAVLLPGARGPLGL